MKNRNALLLQLECYVTSEDAALTPARFLATVASRIADDLRDGTYVGGPNYSPPAQRSSLVTLLGNIQQTMLTMGHVIRLLDEAGDHSELWTNDGEYIPETYYLQLAELVKELS